MKKGEKRNGFTIIEVSLVLAIAGLIFLMVFIALPQLQRSQRDSRRRDDILAFLESVKDYQTNNRGALPTNWQKDFFNSYDGDISKVDPDGTEYILVTRKCEKENGGDNCKGSNTLQSMDHKLYVFTQATCDGENAIPTSNPRKVAVRYRLEGAGTYCANT